MKLKQIYQIYEEIENYDNLKFRKIICKNMKKYRLELYNKYKEEYEGRRGTENPYSTKNISAYLNISENYYRRLESENDEQKNIGIDKLIMLAFILDRKIDDFIID